MKYVLAGDPRQIYRLHARLCRTFSNPLRLEVIDVLRDGELTVSELARRAGAGLTTMSQHLALMREQGVLMTRRDGVSVYYRIANPKMLDAFDLLRQVLRERIEEEHTLVTGRTKHMGKGG